MLRGGCLAHTRHSARTRSSWWLRPCEKGGESPASERDRAGPSGTQRTMTGTPPPMEHERSGTARLNAPRMFSILIHLFLFVFPPRCELSSRLRIHVTEFPQQVRESRSQTRERGPRLLSADGGKAGGEAASRPRLRQPQFTLRVTYTCLPGFFVGTKRIRVGLNVSNRGINSSEKIQKRVRGSRSREMDLSLHRLAGPVTARRGVSAVT